MSGKILVIKLSALGDFVLALGAMEAIRRHHKDAHITLLTTRPFRDIAQRSGYFNDIVIDSRPKFYDVAGWYFLFRTFSAGAFSRVYDLQMNQRTSLYARLFLQKPEWSGALEAASLSLPPEELKPLHAFDRHKAVLARAGIEVSLPDISWMKADVSFFSLKKPYALLIPGSAPRHPEKRWPVKNYTALALRLAQDGITPVLLGTAAEADITSQIARSCAEARDLAGQTSLYDIAVLARGAAVTVGNDTGPTHLCALAGCPTVALFCALKSSAARSGPRGKNVTTIESENLEDITLNDVYSQIHPAASSGVA